MYAQYYSIFRRNDVTFYSVKILEYWYLQTDQALMFWDYVTSYVLPLL